MSNPNDKTFLKIEGLDVLIEELNKIGDEERIEKIKRTALRKAGNLIRDEMKKEAPVDEGKMKESIRNSVKQREDGLYAEIKPSRKYWYYKLLELGTSKMQANPFMTRAFEKNREEAKRIIEKEIKQSLLKG